MREKEKREEKEKTERERGEKENMRKGRDSALNSAILVRGWNKLI